MAGESAALCVQRGGSAVDVVVAGAARRELELAKAEAQAREQREELLRMCLRRHICDCKV